MEIAGQGRGERRLVERERGAGRQWRLVPASDRVLSSRGGEGNENAHAKTPGRDNANRPTVFDRRRMAQPDFDATTRSGRSARDAVKPGNGHICLLRIRLAGLLPAARRRVPEWRRGWRPQAPITCSAISRRCGRRRCSTRKHALPDAEHERAADDRYREMRLRQRRANMRGHVVGAFGVVRIKRRVFRGDAPEEVFQIAQDGRIAFSWISSDAEVWRQNSVSSRSAWTGLARRTPPRAN